MTEDIKLRGTLGAMVTPAIRKSSNFGRKLVFLLLFLYSRSSVSRYSSLPGKKWDGTSRNRKASPPLLEKVNEMDFGTMKIHKFSLIFFLLFFVTRTIYSLLKILEVLCFSMRSLRSIIRADVATGLARAALKAQGNCRNP